MLYFTQLNSPHPSISTFIIPQNGNIYLFKELRCSVRSLIKKELPMQLNDLQVRHLVSLYVAHSMERNFETGYY